MYKQFYFLSPVEVVKVTSQNLAEVAEWCGGSVQETESRRVPGRMDKYVLVPTPKDTNISWAFPGMFITKRLVITVKDELRSTYAVFRRDYFEKNYFDAPKDAVDKTWERENIEKHKKPEVVVANNVGQALLDAQIAVNKAKEMAIEAGADPELLEPKKVAKMKVEMVEVDGNIFAHNHRSTDDCEAAGCFLKRTANGLHTFEDVNIATTDDGYRVLDGAPEAEVEAAVNAVS